MGEPRIVRLLEETAENRDVIAYAELAHHLDDPGAPPDPYRARRARELRRCALEGGYPPGAMGGA